MKKVVLLPIVLLVAAASFVAGGWQARARAKGAASGARAVLYYVDPMHPAYRSDKPGIAPDCGMQLEPVYADGPLPAGVSPGAGRPAGTVVVPADRQQLSGIRVAAVEQAPWEHPVRVLGRVAADETRVYRINATIDGWIRKTYPLATGSPVRKGQPLATFYSPDFLSAEQALIYALSSRDRSSGTARGGSEVIDQQVAQFNLSIRQYGDTLRNLGMGERQIDEMVRRREFVEDIEIASPSNGVLVARNVSSGQRFDKGTELYRIADLSRVWVQADVRQADADLLKPGMAVRVGIPDSERWIPARVSDALPVFDPATRTRRVRLEADNPGNRLLPDMFVHVEIPVRRAPAITVSADAVLDGGLRKTVYVDRGNGVFQPRRVETGWRGGGRVEIVHGLSPGERVAVSGNFLLDSESRMKAAAAGIYGDSQFDPVCGMELDEKRTIAAGNTLTSGGKTFYFCGNECKGKFAKEPTRFARPEAVEPDARKSGASPPPAGSRAGTAPHAGSVMPSPAMPSMPAARAPTPPAPAPEAAQAGPGDPFDPVCGMRVDPKAAKAEGRVVLYRGKEYYFCKETGEACRRKFEKALAVFLEKRGGTTAASRR